MDLPNLLYALVWAAAVTFVFSGRGVAAVYLLPIIDFFLIDFFDSQSDYLTLGQSCHFATTVELLNDGIIRAESNSAVFRIIGFGSAHLSRHFFHLTFCCYYKYNTVATKSQEKNLQKVLILSGNLYS